MPAAPSCTIPQVDWLALGNRLRISGSVMSPTMPVSLPRECLCRLALGGHLAAFGHESIRVLPIAAPSAAPASR